MRQKVLITGLISIIFFLGCEQVHPKSKTGMAKNQGRTELRMLAAFTRIESRIPANIQIRKGNDCSVVLFGMESLFPLIKTTVVDGKLVIEMKDEKASLDKPMRIDIYAPGIDEFLLEGSGDVSAEFPIRLISLAGTGNFSSAGKTEKVEVTISGDGNIDLSTLEVNTAKISIPGTGEVKTSVKQKLIVDIQGTGIVYYKGHPDIEREIRGTGNIVDSN